jgi:hypothetical protein
LSDVGTEFTRPIQQKRVKRFPIDLKTEPRTFRITTERLETESVSPADPNAWVACANGRLKSDGKTELAEKRFYPRVQRFAGALPCKGLPLRHNGP